MLKIFLKKWICLFVIIFFDLIIAIKTAAAFFYLFFWFLVSAVVVSFIWLVIKFFVSNLHLKRIITSQVEEDDVLEIETVVTNKGPFPLLSFILEDYLSCAVDPEKKKWAMVESLSAQSSLSVKYSCQCFNRGKYGIGPYCAYFFDPLGLFFLKKQYSISSELYVYPQTFNIKRFPVLRKGASPWFGIETGRVSGDEHEFYGVREYKPGDPIKRIHWFSTARANTLIVKEFQRQVFFRATLVFNLNKDENYGEGKNSVSEYIVKIAASVAKHLISEGVSLEVIAHAGELVHIPLSKGPGHLADILRFLAVVRPESQIKLDEMFEDFSRNFSVDSNLIVITPDQEWERLLGIPYLKGQSASLIPLILISSSFLNQYPDKVMAKEAQMKLAKVFNFSPIFFACGSNLGDSFIG